MFAHIEKGNNFQGVVNYVNQAAKNARIFIATSGILLTDNKTIANCLQLYSQKGHNNIKDPVRHISLAFSPEDSYRMTDQLMGQIAMEYMKKMGYTGTELIVARHFDTKHPHCHIVFSRVRTDGSVISSSNEKKRNVKVCKELTRKYGLHYSTGKNWVHENRLKGEMATRYQMMHKVMDARDAASDWKQFEKELADRGMSMMFKFNNVNGRIMGVCFKDGEFTYSGKKLDKSLVYSRLADRFGNIKEIVHDNVGIAYQEAKEEFAQQCSFSERLHLDEHFPDFDKLYPQGTGSVDYSGDLPMDRLCHTIMDGWGTTQSADKPSSDFIPDSSNQGGLVSLNLLADLLLQPYAARVSSGGGSTTNNLGWNDDDRKKRKAKFKGGRRGGMHR